MQERTLADDLTDEQFGVRYAVYWDNSGEQGQAREVHLEVLGSFQTCKDFMAEQVAMGHGGYYAMKRIPPDTDPHTFEVRRRSGFDQMWDMREAALDRADYESQVSS